MPSPLDCQDIAFRQALHSDIPRILDSYKESFQRDLTPSRYLSTFSSSNFLNSFVAVNKDGSILVHSGYIPSFSHPSSQSVYRVSTYVQPQYRGTGLYATFMDHLLIHLRISGYSRLYTWPNPHNLRACLKHSSFIYQYPIVTYQAHLSEYLESASRPPALQPSLLSDASSLLSTFQSLDFSQIHNPSVTSQAYLHRLSRCNQINYYIYHDSSLVTGIIGVNLSLPTPTLTLLSDIPCVFSLVRSVANKTINGVSLNKYDPLIQFWPCTLSNRTFSHLLKYNFKPSGPLFHRGFYQLSSINQSNPPVIPTMLDHDAF